MLSLLCASALFLSLPQDCENMWARNVASTTEITGYIDCRTGETLPAIFGGGDRGSSSSSALCPLLVIFTPSHGEPEPMPRWRLTGPIELEEIVLRYACKRDWFLFFPISQPYCQLVSSGSGGKVQSFGSARCPVRADTTTSGYTTTNTATIRS